MNTKNVEKHLSLLGFKAEDKVTGFKGVITTVSFDLYGCVQGIVSPKVDKDGEIPEPRWFDLNRLKIVNKKPVMQIPNFEYGVQAEGNQGCAEKPSK